MSIDSEARALYDACQTPKPTWDQLGDVTKSVWCEYVTRKLAGIVDWWSIRHDKPATLLKAVSAPRIRGALQECINMELNHEQVADVLDEISVLFSKLSGSFRGGAASSVGGGANGKAAKPVRGAKPAAKSAAKKTEEEDELTIDTVREKLQELVDAKGKDKMVEALESVGAGKLADVDESQYQELMDKAQEFIDAEDEDEEPAKPAKKVAAKKTAKAKAVTLEQLTEAARALIEVDKPAYIKLTKKFGKVSECDEDQYGAFLKAIQDAMPEDGDDDEELI